MDMLNSSTPRKHLMVVGNGSLFDDGITHLLVHQTNLRVSRTKYTNTLALIKEVEHQQPNLIVLVEGEKETEHQALQAISMAIPSAEMLVARLSLATNQVKLYEKRAFAGLSRPRNVRIVEIQDFFKAIECNDYSILLNDAAVDQLI